MKIQIPRNLQFLFAPKRYKVLYGGRGGYKTMSIAKALLFTGARNRKKVLGVREFMSSIEDSVHSVLSDEVSSLGMQWHYQVHNNQIKGANGTTFRYSGLSRNLASIKSKHNYDITWGEEAENITEVSLDVLVPTVIRKSGSELWLSFNPEDEFGAVYTRFVKPHLDEIRVTGRYEDKHVYVVKTSLDDNPFAPRELVEESKRMKLEDYRKWLHIFGGEVYSDYKLSVIKPEWVDAAVDAHVKLGIQPRGVKSMGFDPADTGADAKATVLRHGIVVTHINQWKHGELEEAIDQAFSEVYDLRAEYLVFDSDGLGRGVKVGLAPRIVGKNIEVVGYGGNDRVDNPKELYNDYKTNEDTFRNKRAQYIWGLRDRFEATYNAVTKNLYVDPEELISLSSAVPYLDVLKAELVKIERKLGNTSLIQIRGKREKHSMGSVPKSPNIADALAMSFANPIREPEKVPNINFESEF